MRKLGALLIVSLLMVSIPSAYAEETMDAIYLPVGTITLSAPRGIMPQRTPVAFPHSRHFDYNCKTCHHTWRGEDAVKGCAAAGCHDQLSSKADGKEKLFFKKAYHESCIGCHRELKKKRDAIEKRLIQPQALPMTGPTGCVGCHPVE